MKLTMKTSLLSIGLSLAAGSAILLACSPINAASSSSASVQATVDGVKTAKWGDNVKINFADDSFTFTSNGIPNHARLAEYVLPSAGVMLPTPTTSYVGADPTKAQDYKFTIPLNPSKAAKTTLTSLGEIGVMISGAVLFNPYEGDGKSIATLDNFSLKNSKGEDVYFLDSCNAHPTPMGQFQQHPAPIDSTF